MPNQTNKKTATTTTCKDHFNISRNSGHAYRPVLSATHARLSPALLLVFVLKVLPKFHRLCTKEDREARLISALPCLGACVLCQASTQTMFSSNDSGPPKDGWFSPKQVKTQNHKTHTHTHTHSVRTGRGLVCRCQGNPPPKKCFFGFPLNSCQAHLN